MSKSTDRQQQLLTFIVSFAAKQQYPPTYEEIRVGLGWSSKSLVNYHLDQLEARGRIAREPFVVRSLRVTARG